MLHLPTSRIASHGLQLTSCVLMTQGYANPRGGILGVGRGEVRRETELDKDGGRTGHEKDGVGRRDDTVALRVRGT